MRLSRLRLRTALALLLFPTLSVITGVELWMTRHDAIGAANAAYDRSLLGALKSIDANAATKSGGLSVELPYRMFEFFELTARGQVFFRVATSDGLAEVGSADLPPPPTPLTLGAPVFYDAQYFGEDIRLVAFMRELERPLDGQTGRRLIIQVGEGTQSRKDFTKAFVSRAAIRDASILALTLLATALALTLALRPVIRLAAQVEARSTDDLTPIEDNNLPADVQPLVDAVNRHMARSRDLADQQRQFLDDASHQLRTHLTTLQMQADYARRETEPRQLDATLDALQSELGRAARTTNQLLAFARSESTELRRASVDLGELLREVALGVLPLARSKRIDFGVQPPASTATGDADPELLREAFMNLAANAVAYTQEGGEITLSASVDGSGWALRVEDNGPGLTGDERSRLGRRFQRGTSNGAQGSGLGLAIARSIAEKHGGDLRLEARCDGFSGLLAILWWPRRAQAEPHAGDEGA